MVLRSAQPLCADAARGGQSDRGRAGRGHGNKPYTGPKTPKSAVIVMPPVRIWDGIQEIRMEHDKGFYRWMPHINMLYPFYEDGTKAFESAVSSMGAACSTMEPFKLHFSAFRCFVHGKKSRTVWLEPEHIAGSADGEPLQKLHEILLTACPDCTDLSSDPSRGITKFTPHLSVGQWRGEAETVKVMEALAQDWRPLECDVDACYVITRSGMHDPFQVRWKIPLGAGAERMQEMNLQYLAADDGSGADNWKSASRIQRPAHGQHKQRDMKGLRWGLFEEAEQSWTF